MPKYTFDHIHLMSPDPVKTAEFYQNMFGASLINTRDLGNGRVSVTLKLDRVTVLISQSTGDSAQSGLSHFGLRVDNMNEAVDELKAKDVKFTREITQIGSGAKIAYLLAPENVSVELVEVTKG
ncbi:MAG: VOC family protein [Dehalococcoidales bacterium]|nr:VOC family protein [Dehalococcoidales bacterium]